MFTIGDYVFNQNTGHIGKVIGYGYEIFNNVYTTTLKVLLTSDSNSDHKGVVEDLISNWDQYLTQSESTSINFTTVMTRVQTNAENIDSQVNGITNDSAAA
ncbi:hypothetical protein [Gloeocapsopsis dulcis]|uniref:hypothetical protein n=1 Tax=Gloeocapsopsis dulcis TaxID=2859516 RepID=UPI0018C56063|nr:hypothetical protein [Gloeocapsopsis dulcis]WNN89319.1 hypothetical protein P0S91_24315 [Gloeocapsopsis dulcis]